MDKEQIDPLEPIVANLDEPPMIFNFDDEVSDVNSMEQTAFSDVSSPKASVDYEKLYGEGKIDSIGLYLRQISDTPLLTPEQEIDLGRKVQAGIRAEKELESVNLSEDRQKELLRIKDIGDEASSKFVKANLRLAVSIAKRYASSMKIPLLDVIQEANIGVMKAVRKYDPEKGYRFSTYADPIINHAVVRELSNQNRTIQLPYYLQQNISQLRKVTEQYISEYGVEPDNEQLEQLFIQATQSTPTRFNNVVEVVAKGLDKDTTPLDTVADEFGENTSLMANLIQDDSINVENEVISEVIYDEFTSRFFEYARHHLTEKEWFVLERRCGINGLNICTLEEIGKEIGVKNSRVSQIEVEALRKLRVQMGPDYGREILEDW